MDATDPVAAWREAHERVCALVLDVPALALEAHVPACPDWTGRDLLSHVVGLAAVVLGGDEPDDHNEAWTQAQVDARAERSVEELVAEWRGNADDLVAWMGEHGSRPLNDVVIHEQDLRGALARPGGAHSAGVAIVRDRMAERLGRALQGRPPLALVGQVWTWTSDGGPVDAAAVVLEAGDLDLFRALCSRRTADQLRSWTVRGDVEDHLDGFAGLGPLPERPLPE